MVWFVSKDLKWRSLQISIRVSGIVQHYQSSSNITHMSDENAYNWYFRLHSYSRLDMLKFMCNWVMSFTFPLFQSHYKGCYYFWEHVKYFYWGNMCTSTHVTANRGPNSPLARYCHSNKRLWLGQTHLVVIETRDKSRAANDLSAKLYNHRVGPKFKNLLRHYTKQELTPH